MRTLEASSSLLLLVDFPGRPRTRLVAYLALFVVASGLIALGTVVSTLSLIHI